MTGPMRLPDLEIIPIPGSGPEDVLLSEDGRVFFGLSDGRIMERASEGKITTVADTGGRPLGLDWLPDGRLLVCDADRGLLAIDLSRLPAAVDVICDQIDGQPILLCNNAAVAPDGTIWFSASSSRYPLADVVLDFVENTRTGKLVRITPGQAPEVVLDGLGFANGVAHLPGPTGDRVLVASTVDAAIHAVWLSGPRTGERELFATSLPMMPDNLALGTDGLIWVGCPSRVERLLGLVHRLPKPGRRAVAQVAKRIGAKARPLIGVLAFDAMGQLVHRFEQPEIGFANVTTAREMNGTVWLGSLDSAAIAKFRPRREKGP